MELKIEKKSMKIGTKKSGVEISDEIIEDEIAKYTVNKPQIDEDDENLVSYEDIFGSGDLNG